jgi:dihydrofolate synthase/folylpolyglutamate synthase
VKSYNRAEKILTDRRRRGIQLGLERFAILLEKLKNPQKKFSAIHVAGTNGKGSVCAMTESILHQAGYKTGLYTSPHFFEYRERIRIDSKIISKKEFVRYFFEVLEAAEKIEKNRDIFFTEFELLTAATFLCFAKKKVQIAVIETGLGGRLDATNLCQPLVTVITRIGLDHQEFLGNTLKKIAAEKAGIIKTEVSCVVTRDPKTNPKVEKIAAEKKAPVLIPGEKEKQLVKKYFRNLSLKGEFQKENLALVLKIIDVLKRQKVSFQCKRESRAPKLLTALDSRFRGNDKQVFKIPPAAIARGLKNVCWPGRFQIIHKNPIVIIDGGHNPQAAAALVKSLKKGFPEKKIIFVVGILKRKDFRGILDELAKIAEQFILVDNLDEACWTASEMGNYLRQFKKPFEKFSRQEFFRWISEGRHKIFCFTGSFKTAGLGMKIFGSN